MNVCVCSSNPRPVTPSPAGGRPVTPSPNAMPVTPRPTTDCHCGSPDPNRDSFCSFRDTQEDCQNLATIGPCVWSCDATRPPTTLKPITPVPSTNCLCNAIAGGASQIICGRASSQSSCTALAFCNWQCGNPIPVTRRSNKFCAFYLFFCCF